MKTFIYPRPVARLPLRAVDVHVAWLDSQWFRLRTLTRGNCHRLTTFQNLLTNYISLLDAT